MKGKMAGKPEHKMQGGGMMAGKSHPKEMPPKGHGPAMMPKGHDADMNKMAKGHSASPKGKRGK